MKDSPEASSAFPPFTQNCPTGACDIWCAYLADLNPAHTPSALTSLEKAGSSNMYITTRRTLSAVSAPPGAPPPSPPGSPGGGSKEFNKGVLVYIIVFPGEI